LIEEKNILIPLKNKEKRLQKLFHAQVFPTANKQLLLKNARKSTFF
jgi:hypothetical protein